MTEMFMKLKLPQLILLLFPMSIMIGMGGLERHTALSQNCPQTLPVSNFLFEALCDSVHAFTGQQEKLQGKQKAKEDAEALTCLLVQWNSWNPMK